ncbi:MAG: hypothetical protein LBR60_02305 [Fibrobacter sp.]|jgi:hypothetical protein|nr:hypothetical protein [Fibrobacter sp.]
MKHFAGFLFFWVFFGGAAFALADVSAPHTTGTETDAGRWITDIPLLGQRTYDLSGHKSEWVLANSIMGNPDLSRLAMGLSSPTLRLPMKLAGIYTERLYYDRTTLGLNGENGLLLEPHRTAPIDTPLAAIVWERYAFSGNSFRLDFKRLMTDSIQLNLGLASHSASGSKEYRYQDVTHQPFFALGRDSLSIPFRGRNLSMSSMHMKPELVWYLPLGELSVHASFLNVSNDDLPPYATVRNELDLTQYDYISEPFETELESRNYGAALRFAPHRMIYFLADIQTGTHDIRYENLPAWVQKITPTDTIPDTTWFDRDPRISYEATSGSFALGSPLILNPKIHLEYEFLNASPNEMQKKEYEQDRETGYLQLSDTIGILRFRAQTGMQRNSSLDDSVVYRDAYSLYAELALPFHIHLIGRYKQDTRFPDIAELRYTNLGRFAFPNKDLKPEERRQLSGDIQWNTNAIFYGLGIRQEHLKYPIRKRWVTLSGMDSAQTAFQWVNLREAETLDWTVSAGLKLGNWQLYWERSSVLNRRIRLVDTPTRFYKGSIFWSDRFVEERLGVSVRFDFQWFNERYDCELNEENIPQFVRLKPYLALNFEARMEILSFNFYSRIDNLNHSMYYPEAGYTPEGVRFSYGILWTFKN